MPRSDAHVFGLESIRDYLTFCNQAVADLAADQANVLRGFSAILAINHIPDWLQYKLTSPQRNSLGLSETINSQVKDHYEAIYPDLSLIRSIANGFKHLRPTHSTERVSGYGLGPYGIGPYGAPYLLIDRGDSYANTDRWEVALDLCKEALGFWYKNLESIIEVPNNE
jgi:hypothetical protein